MAAVLVVVALGALVAVVVAVVVRERRLAARVVAAADELGASEGAVGTDAPGGTLDRALARIQEGVDRAADDVAVALAVRRRLEMALDAVPEGVVVTDELGRPVYRNAVAATYRDARHSDALVAAALDELVATAVAGGSEERTLELFGPPRRTLVLSATPLIGDRGPAGALAVIEDVTERRRLDEVRRDFVANISHELKTPVGALSLLAETILDEDDPEVVRRMARRMLGEAERVSNTIEDLLALTHIETESTQERAPVALTAVVDEAVARIGPAAEHHGIPLVRGEVDGELVVLGDRRQLVSALSNLLDNAVKYSEPGAAVTVAAHEVDGAAELVVEDHGIGIPARDLERVFERFYRVDGARSRSTGGTGLGLAIVRHVVVNHAGEVRVASRLGEGSTFTLRLPLPGGGPGVVPRGEGAEQTAAPHAVRPDEVPDRDGPGRADADARQERDGDQEHLGAGGGGRGLLRGGADRRVAT